MLPALTLSLGLIYTLGPTAIVGAIPALEQRNIEQNLRWILERELARKPTASPEAVAVYADAGAWHLGVKSLVAAIENDG
ncbi:MAG: hypothetical protein ACRCZF_19420, partial [Gemmataceae bacterium]